MPKSKLYTNPKRIKHLTRVVKSLDKYLKLAGKESIMFFTAGSVRPTLKQLLKDEKRGWMDEPPARGASKKSPSKGKKK